MKNRKNKGEKKMSMWTHIVASLDVETYIESNTIKEDVEKMLKKAPKITGSEGPADIFVNVLSGHNVSCWDGDDRREYQTRVVITVIGDLRDRMKAQTEDEWSKFKNFIGQDEWAEEEYEQENSLNFTIRNCAYEIKGY